MRVEDRELGDFLLASGRLSRCGLEETLREHEDEPLGPALVARGHIADEELRRAYAHVAGLPFVVLAREIIEPEALFYIPEPLARAHNLLAFRVAEGMLDVAVIDPESAGALRHLSLPPVKLHVTSEAGMKHGLLYYQKLLKERFSKMVAQSGHAVEAFLHHALLSHAHGVHIDLSTAGAIVRYRVGEVLHEAMRLPEVLGRALVEKLKELAGLALSSHAHQEGRFKFEHGPEAGRGVYERHAVALSVSPTVSGERLVLRIARESEGASGFSLASLGFHGVALERAHGLLMPRAGLILIAGMRGSGKSSCAYTLLDHLPLHALAVATVEKRVERSIAHVAHTLVRPSLGIDAAAALRGVLRTSPDVVLIDSVEGAGTALLAAQAANRGVFIIACTEAPSASEAVAQFLRAGVEGRLLASVLRGVVGVSLTRKLCPREREAYRLSRVESAPLEPYADFGRVLAALKEDGFAEDAAQWKELLFPRAVPCAACEEGYVGTLGIQEVLVMNRTIQRLIETRASAAEIEREARAEGMLTLLEDALYKAAAGHTSIEEVFRLAGERS